MSTTPSPRHLQREGLQEYLAAAVAARLPLEGEPQAFLVVDGPQERVAIRVPWEGEALPDLTAYRHFESDRVLSGGVEWFEVAITGTEFLIDAYPVLCAIADRVQLDHLPINIAVAQVLEMYREMLGSIGRLSEDQEVGLYGELLVLEHLIATVGQGNAVTSWRGPASEEHDYGLTTDDVEVKSTTTETRRHWIGTVTQLQPTAGRALWLVSLQLTAAGIGGRTLPEVIAAVRQTVAEPDVRTQLEERLTAMHWNDAHAPLYRRSLRLRSRPEAYRVSTGFPAITPTALQTAGLPVDRIQRVAYQIDLTGWLPGAGPPELQGLLSEVEPQ